jgi:DNA-binding FadR family transcriptional regulator
MQLKILSPGNLNAQVVEAIGQRIVKGQYKEGEQLPVEADLCVEFGVSRPIMREATKVLFAKGLLTSRPKVGTLVRKRTHWNLLDNDVLTWFTQATPPEQFLDMMFEARTALEPYAAELAATKASKRDIAAIRKAYEDMAAASGPTEALEPDIRFHQAVMNATHNEVIRYIGHTLHKGLALSIQLTSWNAEIHSASLPRHQAIYQAIANRDGNAARDATLALLRTSRRDFDKKTRSGK